MDGRFTVGGRLGDGRGTIGFRLGGNWGTVAGQVCSTRFSVRRDDRGKIGVKFCQQLPASRRRSQVCSTRFSVRLNYIWKILGVHIINERDSVPSYSPARTCQSLTRRIRGGRNIE